jgi:hypothetical protein
MGDTGDDEGPFDDSQVPRASDWTPEQLEKLRRFVEDDDIEAVRHGAARPLAEREETR